MNDTGEYQLHVLGTFTLERGGQIVKFPRRKATALFAYLALHPQVHTRDQLDTLLWGDYLDDEARQSLRTALSTIRREVGDDVLIVDNETVRLNPTFPLWVDAVSFETYAKRFLAEPPFDLSTAFIDLYEGDLLPDVYDDWVVAEREHLHALYVAVLLQTAEQMRSRSEYGRALDFAQRVLAIEPSNERAHQHVMFCYVAKGDRTAALRQYETCQAVLQNDLGVEPMPETRSLYQWIKGQPAHAAAKEARITNLPLPLTSFIGRERETAEIKRALSQHRLVTLTGMGGSGKTRLAIQVASDLVDMYKNGVWFVDLAGVQNPSSVVNAAAQALGAPIAPNQPAAEALVAFLHSRHILIVLDNCEHVIGACAEVVDDAVRSCPKVSILTTSREPLNVTGEIVRLVPPLPVPAADVIPQSLAALSPCAATQLFVQRATMAYPGVSLRDQDAPAVATICRQLDGMPLAIELAAARAKVLSVRQIADHLHERFALLTSTSRTSPPRQMSLQATVDWSYGLLGPEEQALLRRLSVFAGSFSLRAAAAVYGEGASETAVLDVLARLVEKSLLVVDQDAEESRYHLLESIKLYAWARLGEAGERDSAIQRYLAFYCAWSEELWQVPAWSVRQQADSEHHNLRQAVDWCRETGDVERGVYLMERYWGQWGRWGELQHFVDWIGVITASQAGLSVSWQAKTLTLAGKLARFLPGPDHGLSFDFGQRGLAAARESGDRKLVRWATLWLGPAASSMGKESLAVTFLEETLQLDVEIGPSRLFDLEHGTVLHCPAIPLWLAEALTRLGDSERTLSLLEDGLTEARRSDIGYAISHGTAALGRLAMSKGDYDVAAQRFKESVRLSVKYSDVLEKIGAMDLVAQAAAAQGREERAVRLWGAVDAARAVTNNPRKSSDEGEYQERVSGIHHQLGNQAFDKVYATGQAMTIEQAVAYALSDA